MARRRSGAAVARNLIWVDWHRTKVCVPASRALKLESASYLHGPPEGAEYGAQLLPGVLPQSGVPRHLAEGSGGGGTDASQVKHIAQLKPTAITTNGFRVPNLALAKPTRVAPHPP